MLPFLYQSRVIARQQVRIGSALTIFQARLEADRAGAHDDIDRLLGVRAPGGGDLGRLGRSLE